MSKIITIESEFETSRLIASTPRVSTLRVSTLRVTAIERVVSGLVTIAIGLFIASVILGATYYLSQNSRWSPSTPSVIEPLGLVIIEAADVSSANEEQSLLIETPEKELTDPSPTQNDLAQNTDEQIFEQLPKDYDKELDVLLKEVAPGEDSHSENKSDKKRHRCHMHRDMNRITSKELRWDIVFDEKSTLEEYAKQLDFFKIELGSVVLSEGKMYRRSQFSKGKPVGDEITSGKDETRLYFARGRSHPGDVALLKKANVPTDGARLLRIYPASAEKQLQQVEAAYAKKNKKMISQVRRTIFNIVPLPEGKKGYQFKVKVQYYF